MTTGGHPDPSADDVLVDPGGQREFRLLRRLGSGGFGEVHLAKLRSPGGLEQRVAVKLLRPDVDKRAQAVERLRDEAAVLASLHHPVILVAHDLVQLQDRIALVTEYVEGQDLGEVMADPADPIPAAALIEVIGQVAGALDAAFGTARIVHRDIKPENIRIGRHGNVKLLDFGIAKSAEATSPGRTRGNALVGSVSYLAPERFERGRAPHPASDVFALGCVLYEGLSGAQLFEGLDLAQMFALSATPSAYEAHLEERLSRIGHPLERELIGRMVARDPDRRIPAGEIPPLCDAIQGALPAHRSLRVWCRSRRWPEGLPDEQTPLPAGRSPSPLPRRIPAEPTSGFGTVSQPSPAPADRPLSTGSGSRPRPSRGWIGIAAFLGLSGLASVGVAALIVIGLLLAAGRSRVGPEPPPTPEPAQVAPAPSPAPEVPAPEVPAPEAKPAPEAPAPAVKPAPEAPAPVATPAPSVLPAPTVLPARPPASVSVRGEIRVELRGQGRIHRPGDPVPAGSYELYADFGRGPEAAGTLTLASGQSVRIGCNSILLICKEIDEGPR